jgi:diguanylate cyclase (GGDEF)-like protein
MPVLQKIEGPVVTLSSETIPTIGLVNHGPYLLPELEQISFLLEGQQEALELVARGATFDEMLGYLSLLVERALAPVACRILLTRSNGEGVYRNAAPNLSPVLIAMDGNGTHPSGGPAEATLNGRRTVVEDFATDPRWPDHAAQALAHNFRACWCEPLGNVCEGISGSVALYYPSPRDASTGDERILAYLVSLIRVVLQAAHREAALRADAERYGKVTSLPGVVVYQRLVTPDDKIHYTYISDGAEHIFGVSAREIVADPNALFSCHRADYSAKFRERLLGASRALTTWDVEASIVSRDGHKRYTHAIARPDRQSDGSVLWTGIILDETRTREAIVESLSQGFLLFDAEDQLIIRNSHFLDIYPGLRDIAVPGARYADVVRAEIANGVDTSQALDTAAAFRWRIKRHLEPHVMFERPLAEDRWVLINEHRTSDGGTVVLYTDISELKRRESQVRHMAYHDGLTGIPNRALFHQRVEQLLAGSRKSGDAVAVVCVDLDRFKTVNDMLGHPGGDSVLKCTAERLRACVRDTDIVARLGGDEFGIAVTDFSTPDHMANLAWRLLNAVAEPMEHDGQQVVIGVSIGIAVSTTDGSEAVQLLKNADLALYRAKVDGRGTFRFFESEMDARAQARRALEINLRQAIAKQQLELHYQPQVDINTNAILGFEALVRWRHPERGLISPAEFIPLAEESGIIGRLGEWVLRRACLDALTWPASMTISVNVSPAQFKNRDFANVLANTLKETGLPAERLELEVTESLMLRDVASNLRTLEEIKRLGVRIAMDDFGTGYSSLGNLRSFPFDKIKIDQSFVGDLGKTTDAEAIIRAVIGLGDSLGMQTCAEGVETDEQLAFLRREGCAEVQGFYYAKPQPLEKIAEVLQAACADNQFLLRRE